MYSITQKRSILDEVYLGETYPSKRSKTNPYNISQVARRHNLSERTIRRWIERDNQEQLETSFVQNRGRKSKLNEGQQTELISWLNERNNNYQSCTGDEIRAFIAHTFNIQITPSGLSKLLRRLGFAAHKTQKRAQQRTDPNYNLLVDNFRAQWRTNNATNYLVMDESGIWNDHVIPRSYSPIGGGGPQVASPGSSNRDTIAATLRGNGEKLPLYYLKHKRQRTKNNEVVERAVKGFTEAIMLDYINQILVPNVAPGTVLFLDNLSSHKTTQVQNRLRELGIIPVYFPPKAAPDLSPCDNVFFHLFKNEFRKLDRSTPELKREAAFVAYEAISASKVRSCWKKCGLLYDDVDVEPHLSHQEDEEVENSDF